MIVFEVFVDGQHVCTAGSPDVSVLSAILTWTSREAVDRASHPSPDETRDLSLHVGGSAKQPDGSLVLSSWFSQTVSGELDMVIRVRRDGQASSPSEVTCEA